MAASVQGNFTGNNRGVPTRELENLTASVAITASHAVFAERISSETRSIGSGINPVFVGSGSLTPISGTVGDETSSIYLKAGIITKQTASVGSGTNPVYQNNGQITASKATVGSWDQPTYLNGGEITAANKFSNFLPLTGGVITGPLGVTGSVSVSGSLDIRSGDFYLSGAGEYDGTNKASSDTVQEVLRKQNGALVALAAGAKVSLSISPGTIYKNTATTLSFVGTLSNVTPSSMRILDGNTVIAQTSSCDRVAGSKSENISANSKTYTCEAVYEGFTIIGKGSINARYPILYGFATAATALTKKISPTTSAVRTYSDKSTANGQRFYIAVPTDISDVSNFAMGGAPFAMRAVTTQTINNITYKVHESDVAYNANTTVTVAAS